MLASFLPIFSPYYYVKVTHMLRPSIESILIFFIFFFHATLVLFINQLISLLFCTSVVDFRKRKNSRMERSSEVSSFDTASRQQQEGRLRLQRALRGIAYASLTCIFTLGGAIVGSVTGALKGQTTETGLFRGAGIGAVAGAVVSVELMESLIQGDILSKITVFASLVNGKIFREWVSPAMLKAYQWQISTLDQANDRRELSDIFDVNTNDKAMSAQSINRLPEFDIQMLMMTTDIFGSTVTCSVCLQDFRLGERCRRLPSCNHYFHKLCIDMWLLKHGSCPICRRDV